MYLKQVSYESFPEKKIPKISWFTNELKAMREHVNLLQEYYKQHNNENNFKILKEFKK